MYGQRLVEDKEKLKVHSYRAILENLFRSKQPSLSRASLKTVTKTHEKSFMVSFWRY